MASDDTPLHSLTHEAKPGYKMAFLIAFLGMAAYLAVIIVSSPGKVKKGHGYGKNKGHAEKYEEKKGH